MQNMGELRSPFESIVDQWEEDNNTIVRIAKEITGQLQQMTDFHTRCGTFKGVLTACHFLTL